MTPVDRDPGQSHAPSRVIWLEEPLLRDIRELLSATIGQVGPAFTLIDLDENGLRGAAVDAETGQCLIELNDHTLHGSAFDRALADYLVRTGKAKMPETAEWARELVDLMPRARLLLGGSAGTFLMGKSHVGLLRVTRADLDDALAPSAVRAISVARSVAIASPAPVTATVMMPNHSAWPGLIDALGVALSVGPGPQIPVLPLRNAAVLKPAEAPGPGKHARPSEPELPVPAPAPVLPAPPLPPHGLVSAPIEPIPDPVVAARRNRQNRLVLLGAAFVSVLIVVGCATLLATPWRDDAGEPQSQRYLTTPDPTVTNTSSTPTPSSTPAIPPINTAAALAPIVSYTTPPPPPSTTTRRPAPRPRQNTIPNPIPGQPPIILP